MLIIFIFFKGNRSEYKPKTKIFDQEYVPENLRKVPRKIGEQESELIENSIKSNFDLFDLPETEMYINFFKVNLIKDKGKNSFENVLLWNCKRFICL